MLIPPTSEVPPAYLRIRKSPQDLLPLRWWSGSCERSSCTDPDASDHQLAPTLSIYYG